MIRHMKKIHQNKRGMFFTIIAVLLIGLAVFAVTIRTQYSLRERAYVIETRVLTMNSFIKDVNRDLERALYIASFRSFLALQAYTSQNQTYLSNTQEAFTELVMNGTLFGDPMLFINDSHLTRWLEAINQEGNEIGVNISFSNINVTLYQEDPWFVTVDLNISFTVVDTKGLAQWEVNTSTKTQINITDFDDPIYSIKSEGTEFNRIVKSPINVFVIGNDTSPLMEHISKGYYIATNISPSFLMRFEYNLTPSPYGIESLVAVANISEIRFIKNRTIVDFYYWNGVEPSPIYRINQTPDWVLIDNESGRLNYYGIPQNMVFTP
ncbi:hypothetical protein HYW21_00100 [Candidatus Woesearchaeota archaeon]|nr:hypothetical protein [Candidatus Woesearchaeota archaeon]